MINRDDMLELTRRMTDSRTHLMRLAGAYLDDEGYIDGTFNTAFFKLKGAERQRVLNIAKAIPFSKTNIELTEEKLPAIKPGSIWQLLNALRDCELKNDALLLSLYEFIGEQRPGPEPYAVYVYYGCYDIPRKGADHAYQDESEEVYRYLILALCPLNEDQEAELPFSGFLYPALNDRSADSSKVNLFAASGHEQEKALLKEILFN